MVLPFTTRLSLAHFSSGVRTFPAFHFNQRTGYFKNFGNLFDFRANFPTFLALPNGQLILLHILCDILPYFFYFCSIKFLQRVERVQKTRCLLLLIYVLQRVQGYPTVPFGEYLFSRPKIA